MDMALHKCPKCELNYIRDGEEICDVCKRELKRAQARLRHADDEPEDDEVILCTECGEAPAIRGSDLCAACLKEQKRQVELENAAEINPDYDEPVEEEDITPDEE